PAWPNVGQASVVQPSHSPLPFRSSDQMPLRNTPILVLPEPVQSPTTGLSPGAPKPRHRSTLHPSQWPLPFRSSNQPPLRNTPRWVGANATVKSSPLTSWVPTNTLRVMGVNVRPGPAGVTLYPLLGGTNSR